MLFAGTSAGAVLAKSQSGRPARRLRLGFPMIAGLVAAGLIALAIAVVGGRRVRALASAPARIMVAGIGVALLLAAGTSAFLARLPAPSASAPSPAAAPAGPRIQRVVLVPDDTMPGAAPRDSRTAAAALAAFRTELEKAGIAVQDGRGVALLNEQQENARRSDAEIVQLARRQAQAGAFDAVVLFTALVSADFTLQAQNPYLRGRAAVLRATDARNAGTFEWASPVRTTVPYACDRACVLETVVAEAPVVGTNVGANLLAGLVASGLR